MQINEHPEVLLYTRIRKSPYFYASRRHGVQRYSFYNHMYHPRHYGDPVEEYWQLLKPSRSGTSASSGRWRSPGRTRSGSRTCSSRAT
jgi:hypothetical protein